MDPGDGDFGVALAWLRQREIPRTESNDPARAAWLDLLLTDREAARRERELRRLEYWRRRRTALEKRLLEWCRLWAKTPRFLPARAQIARISADLAEVERQLRLLEAEAGGRQ